ncbi:Transposase [Belliella pelovolcani]|uniref:Transposase n=3 Tax=Belliella pelovolcani TaxID=529505 RepID=A0A1N7Q6L8_9BACT|nr:Transposase [Belliella pelovolcani]
MANRTLTMNKIKQILRGHFDGHGSKQLSKLMGVSRNTVKSYLKRFRQTGLSFEEVNQLSDEGLAELILGPPSPVQQSDRLETLLPLLPGIVKKLRTKGMTRQRLWEEYREKHPDGFQSSQFRKHIREYVGRQGLTMHFDHPAGEKVFIDYAGKKLHVTDPETGEHFPVEVFVATLGCTQYTYVEATYTQQKPDFIGSCTRMLEFFGGVPRVIVPDNLRSAVSKGSKYSPVLNETFETFAEHYNTTIIPARPRQPREKSLVEGAVRLVYQRIYMELQGKVFLSLESLNEALFTLLANYNDYALRGEESRREQFETLERSSLLALPELPYQLMSVKVCTVMKNTHICLGEDKHYYSVPHQYMGKKVKVLFNDDRVEIFYKYHPIAKHKRDKRKHKYTTLREHLSGNHKYVSDWSYEFFVEKGNKINKEVGTFLSKLMEFIPHPEQGFRSCSGILHLARKVGTQRITAACKRASEYGVYTYSMIEQILSKNLDSISFSDEQLDESSQMPKHHNIRGNRYYS